jgi:DNA-directed RNA polymerase specialized sigma24 family protein
MSSPGSVTHWIGQLRAGDHATAEKLWARYFERLVGLARSKLRGSPRRAADEEDVALSALDSFCRGAQRGRFPQLFDRDDLWQILIVITERKAIDLLQHERRQKRGGAIVPAESRPTRSDRPRPVRVDIDEIMGPEPTPELVAQVADECQRLLARLDNDELRAVALWKMEGYTNEEIAVKLDCVPRTVERKLRLIRSRWKQEITND